MTSVVDVRRNDLADTGTDASLEATRPEPWSVLCRHLLADD